MKQESATGKRNGRFSKYFVKYFLLVHMDGLDLDVTSVKADLEPQGRHLN